MNKPLVVILATVTLDAIGIGLIFPILPSLLRDLAGTPEIATLYGVILALYATMQFIFSPVLGVLSDRFGRRPVLLLSMGGAAVDYLLMIFAPALWMLVVGRAIAGVTSASMATATGYLVDVTPEAQRPQRFGLFHAMFGIGFIIGPVLGGFLGDIWVRAPFIAAAVLNAINFAMALFILPESRPGNKAARFQWGMLNPLKPLAWAFSLKAMLPLLAIWFVFNLTGQVYGTCWALWGQDAFGWSGLLVGLSLGCFGLFQAAAQAFVPGPAARWFGARNAMLIGMLCEGVSLVTVGFTTAPWVVFAIMPLFALGGIGVPALQTLMTGQVGADQQGQLQGVLSSFTSLASIIGPLFFSSVYFVVAPTWPGLIWLSGLGIYLLAVPLIVTLRTRPAAPALP